MKIKPVENWRHGWKWLSNWAFVLVVFLATTPLPPELLMLLPEENQKHVIAIVAFAGLILRFVSQSKNRTWS
ncbi:hypothetical protein [Psychrobacter sp. AT9]|uniref:DUF7940 domain-containing protein n=1 Tax=Psychrobacter sp. AT9 TaxID=3242893 RepID=UPI0039A6805E